MSSVKHISFACNDYYFCCTLIFSFVKVKVNQSESRRNKCCDEQILELSIH